MAFFGTHSDSSPSASQLKMSNGDVNPKEDVEPATGWMHNQPDKSSSYWVKASTAGEAQDSGSPTNDKETKEPPKTGWLHNISPQKTEDSKKTDDSPTETEATRLLRLAKEKQKRDHRIVSPPTFHECNGGRRAVVTEHKIAVPLSRTKSESTIDVFFRIAELIKSEEDETFFRALQAKEMTPQKRAECYVEYANMADASAAIVFLQGGPGFGSPVPYVGLGLADKSSWGAQAFSEGFKRVVLMDQRGTGRSSTITKQTLEAKFPDLFRFDEATEEVPEFTSALENAVEYMSCFRADNIVQDAEDIKDSLLVCSPAKKDGLDTPLPWGAALGQSFGGFCMMTYLSQISHPPKICLLTGGIAPMLSPPYEVYSSLYERVKTRNLRYYEEYPADIPLVKTIVQHLLQNRVVLPSGGIFTARRFLQLGISLGGTPTSFASMHYLLNSAFVDEQRTVLSRAFLKQMDAIQPFDDYPIYYLLHESIYADGSKFGATNWAAHRAFEDRTRTPSDFSYEVTSRHPSDNRPTLFTGEMIFPWMSDGDYAECSGRGMKSLADALAAKTDWGPLYDAERMRHALEQKSKAAAAVYYDDFYVDFDECIKVTKRDGPMERCKVWITNEFQHSGLRDDGAEIFKRLLGMAKGSVRIPS